MARLEVPQLAQDAGWGRNNAVAEKMVAAGRHVVHGPSPAIRMGFRFRHLLQNETPAIVFFYLDKHLPLCNIHRALINRTSILLRTNQPGVRTGKRRKTTKNREREERQLQVEESPVQYTAIICYPTLFDINRPATTSAVSTTAPESRASPQNRELRAATAY